MITLKRIEDQVDYYTGPWQCGYKRGRSCADLVWSQRMLLSVVLDRRWEYHRMGIDMSSAFDTINRQTILNLLKDAGCTEDGIRLSRVLLSNTKLKVRVNSSLFLEFESTRGSFQGDCASGCFFTLTLAGSLNHVRVMIPSRPILPIGDNGLPLEDEYADDVTFCDEDEQTLRDMLPMITEILREWSLYVNESKTEFTAVYLARKDEYNADGKSLHKNEPWRDSVTLGSILCSTKDIKHRITLANAAFANFKKVWLQGPKISLSRKLMVYEAHVLSIVLYNSSSWAAPAAVINKIDTCHRKHLKRILKIHWPNGFINTATLYKRCNTSPLSERINKSRWALLGHILRMPENASAHLALHFALDGAKMYKGRVGRHQMGLLTILREDVERRDVTLRTALMKIRNDAQLGTKKMTLRDVNDLYTLRDIAKDRSVWRTLF